MPHLALLLPILASALSAPQPVANDIVVTGHAWPPFISPMGEPFRTRAAGGSDSFADWFRQADRNRDGVLTPEEMRQDAERFFAKLDTDHDGQIDPDELAQYEWEIAPEIQVNSKLRRPRSGPSVAPQPASDERDHEKRPRHRDSEEGYDLDGLEGAARYALLNIPEPVAAADKDFNRAITLAEFRQAAAERFQLLDSRHEGKLSQQVLAAMLPQPPPPGQKAPKRSKGADTRVGNPLPPEH
jgi:Ca2+-binding EF-hand superfamily protein